MHTLTVDDKKRVRIPDAKPGQVLAYTDNGDGSYTLVTVKPHRKERFPRGSLLKYFTPERDKEEEKIFRACVKRPE